MTSRTKQYFRCALKIQEVYVNDPCKETALKALYALRTAGIRLITGYNLSRDKFRYLERNQKKANIGIYMLNPFERDVKKYRKAMSNIGLLMFELLDEWQRLGGTFVELCHLCNVSAEYGLKLIDDTEYEDFKIFCGAYTLDYKNTGDFIENIPDAPFTVCMKEYMIDKMINTKAGRQAGREALLQTFPELFDDDTVLYQRNDGGFEYIDEYGERHCFDKDGVETQL